MCVVKDDVVEELVDYGVTTVVGNLSGEPCLVEGVEITQNVGVVECDGIIYVELKVVFY